MRVRWAALPALLLACGTEHEPLLSAPSVEHVVQAAREPVSAPAPVFRGARVVRVAGAPQSSGPIAPDERVVSAQVLGLPVKAAVTLDFPSGARVEVLGPALIQIDARSEHGLLIRQGLVRVELPPGGAKPGEPFWLATPALRLELPRAARFVLRVDESGRTQIAVVGGRVSLQGAADEPDAGLRGLEAGRLLNAELEKPPQELAGPVTLEQASTQLAAPASLSARPATAELEPGLRPLLESALKGMTANLAQQKALDAQHAQLVARHDSAAMGVQKLIAEHAAQMFRARRRLQLAVAHMEAARIKLAGAAPPDPVLTQALALLR